VEPSKIVIRFSNGKILKGYTQNFFPNKPAFHFRATDADKSSEAVEIRLTDLKAVFFVRDFLGDKLYQERKSPAAGDKPQGRIIEVTFKDGEVMAGSTTGYDPARSGFFLFPLDPKSNNMKVYIVSHCVTKVRFL